MNFLKKYFKHVIMGGALFCFILMLGLGIGLSAFGMGMQSQRFINSVENVIDKYVPKGKVVIDSTKASFVWSSAVIQLKKAYTDDILSSLTTEQLNDQTTKDFYTDYANNYFTQKYGNLNVNKVDIDINTFSHDLVQFDIQVAKEFHNYGYTHAGIQWLFKNGAAGDLLSPSLKKSDIYKEANQNQQIMDVNAYANGQNLTGKALTSFGTYLVNNKIWFMQSQFSSISRFAGMVGLNPLVDNTYALNELKNVALSTNDFYIPNFTKSLEQTQVGAVFLLILTPIFAAAFIGLTTFVYIKYPSGL